MANKKLKIPFFAVLIVTFAILIAGIVVTAFCGINLGFKEAGGTQIRIDLSSANQVQAKNAAEKVLSDNKITIDSIIVEDKGTTSYLTINIADKTIEKLDAVKSEIASNLAIDAESVTSVVVKSTIKNEVYLTIGLVIVGLIVALFVFGLIRHKLAGGLTLGFGFLVQIMLPLALVFCTRLQLTLAGIVTILVSAFLQTLFAVIMLEKYRAQTKGKSLDDGDEANIMGESVKSTLEVLIFTIAALLIPTIIMLFMGTMQIIMLALVVLITLLSLAFTTLLIVPKTNVSLSEISRLRLEAHLSKNNSPAPAKKKNNKK